MQKTATTDQNGRFTLEGLTPGEHRIYAWDSYLPLNDLDPEQLKPFEQFAATVKLKEEARAGGAQTGFSNTRVGSMHRCLLRSLAALLTPAMAQWPLVTPIPAPFPDRPPAIAAAANGDILTGSADRVMRISQDGQDLWNSQVPLEQTIGVTASRDDGAFAVGWTGADSFILKIDANGTVTATYPLQGEPAALAVDASGSVYIAGSASEGFTATSGAWKTSFGTRRCSRPRSSETFACSDAFVIKMRSEGTVEWATLLGGTWTDRARGITVDAEGGVWIAGETMSDDFVTTPNAVQRSFGGRVPLGPLEYGDGFLARLDRSGSRLLYATYLRYRNSCCRQVHRMC